MKILITGATGFIGQNLIKSLVEQKYNIHILIRENSDISMIDTRVNVFRHNENIDTLITFFKKEQFDGVIHLASLFLTSHNSNDIVNLISSNIRFGTELLEASKISNVKWFLNTGTFWQNYNNEKYSPVNLYAATKEAFQDIAKYYTETSTLIFTTIKLNDTFGSNDTRNKVFNLWNKISKSGETLGMSAGEQIIDISYIEDVINAYMLLIEYLTSEEAKQFNNKTFVVSSTERMSLRELSKVFEKTTNKKLNINWGAKDYREREVMNPFEEGTLVPKWKQTYTLKEAILKTLEEN